MNLVLNRVLGPLRALLLSAAVLCLLTQPVFSAAHELHEAGHALAAQDGSATELPDEASGDSGKFGQLLHAFDCCLHATALTGTTTAWDAAPLRASPPRTGSPALMPAPLHRFLRPPISA